MARNRRPTRTGARRGPGDGAEVSGLPLDPALCVFRHVTRTTRAVAALYDQLLTRAGLTGHQFTLLMTLHQLGPASVGELARRVGMDASTVPRTAAPLLRQGFIVIGPDEEDRRVRILSLTPRGKRGLKRAIPHWIEAQSLLLAELGAEAWPPIVGQLAAVRAAARRIAGSGRTQR